MFETEVYKNCYPYTRESLLDFDKRQMILKLLNIREKDLCFVKYEAKKNVNAPYPVPFLSFEKLR